MKHKHIRLFTIYAVIFSFIFFTSPGVLYRARAAGSQNSIYLDAKGAILMDMQGGKVLYQKNGDDRLYPASTTKILTALVALENGGLEDTVTVGKEVMMIPWDSSKAFLKEGEQIKLRELTMGLLLPSGNDAAMTIAIYIGRKAMNDMSVDETKAVDKFVELMNDRARKAGATGSNFVNPHGYHNNNHYTTPHDLALITREAMKIAFFREVVGTLKYNASEAAFSMGQTQESIGHTWINTNELIDKTGRHYYEYATGVKTGYTTPAGHCVVSSASKDGLDLIAVILNDTSQGRWEDSKKLFDYGFDNYGYYKGVEEGQTISTLKVDNPSSDSPESLAALSEEGFAGIFGREDVLRIKKDIAWDQTLISPLDGQNEVRLLSSIEAGQVIGKMVFTLDGDVLREINLKAEEGVKKQGIIDAAVETVGPGNVISFFAGLVFGAVSILMLRRKAAANRRQARI